MKEAPFFLRVASPEEIEEDRIRREEEERRARLTSFIGDEVVLGGGACPQITVRRRPERAD